LLIGDYCMHRLDDRSRMSGDVHVRFCESLRGRFPWATLLIITGISKEFLENEVKPVVEEFLAKRDLTLSAEKTKITHIDKGFDFLGFNIRKYNDVLLIKPAKDNIKAFLNNIRDTIKSHKMVTTEVLIALLNPKITGWGNYHRHIVASEAFKWCDYQIFKALWRWAKRRHPMKGGRWIKERYFKSVGRRKWVFATTTVTEKGDKRLESLRYLSEIKIVRHTKIKVDVNPYNPNDEEYFEKRQQAQMLKSLTGRIRIASLWKRQNGYCPCCQQLISKQSIWDIHHVVRKTDGGSDNLDNLVMLHTNCHRQVHVRTC